MVDRKTRLAIIPAVVRGRLSHTSELLSGLGMRDLLEEARKSFDYIIVDLPPLGPVVDAKAFAPLADGFILVAKWGATPRALVRTTLESEPTIAAKMLGLVLNMTDMKKLGYMERSVAPSGISAAIRPTMSTSPQPTARPDHQFVRYRPLSRQMRRAVSRPLKNAPVSILMRMPSGFTSATIV